MPEVTIIGAGIAGLSAALRLVERGFDVTIFEEDAFIGGKLGAHNHSNHPNDYHEHSYHMYLSWYHNFWKIIDEIGIGNDFAPQSHLYCIKPEQPPRTIQQTNIGAPAYWWQNTFAGPASPLHMFLYSYSMIDLLSTSMQPRGDFDDWSLYGFLNSRSYMTDQAMKLHGLTLARAFACPTFLSEARTYRHFAAYSAYQPEPMMWLLKGNSQQFLFNKLTEHLERIVRDRQDKGAALRIYLLSRIERMQVEDGKIIGLEVAELAGSPTIDLGRPVDVKGRHCRAVNGEIIVAIPPKALGALIDAAVYSAAPSLKNIRRLDCLPMASFDIYFRRKLRNIPNGITILLDSMHELTFLDTSQLWPQDPESYGTSLNVVMSDFHIFSDWYQEQEVQVIKDYVLRELKSYIEFDDGDVDYDRCHFQANTAEELFINTVGSWQFRPETKCGIENLFIAGDFCKTPIDVVTVEGAVVSGLMAAEAIRQQHKIGDPIEILKPAAYPQGIAAGLQYMGMPLAFAAKAAYEISDTFRTTYEEIFPRYARRR